MQQPQEQASLDPKGGASAARGIMLAVLLSAPVWLGLALSIWRMTQAP